MKVTFSWAIKTYSGYGDNNVYSRWLEGRLCVMRNYKYPRLTVHNEQMGLATQNLSELFGKTNPLYQTDLEKYRDRRKLVNKSHNPVRMKQIASPFCLFMEMMYAWQASDPTHIDLATVTLGDIVSIDADVRTVSRAIGARFLKKAYPNDDLNHDIQV